MTPTFCKQKAVCENVKRHVTKYLAVVGTVTEKSSTRAHLGVLHSYTIHNYIKYAIPIRHFHTNSRV